jgi:ATP-dependent DNA helicase DinG
MMNKYVVIDLETTGSSPKRGDKILQFAAVVIENGKITEAYSSLLNPQQKIPPFIEELTGINQEMVKDAPIFSEIAQKVVSLLDDAYFVAHNVLFDLSFLQEELIDAGFEGFYGPVLDTVELARILLPTADSYKLSDLAQQEGLVHERPHQADSDAYVTAELLQLFINRLLSLPRATLRQLAKLSGGLKSDIQMLLEDLLIKLSQNLEEVHQDIEFHRGIALKKTVIEDLNKEFISYPFPHSEREKEELLKKVFPAFEQRRGQYRMMESVFQALSDEKHALIEAGTGIGKSLAYLIPGLLVAKQTGKPVIISTFTTQLQQQLVSKEIQFLKKMFPFPISISLLKGRSHYLSLAKFTHSLLEEDDNYDTTLSKMQILVWLLETETGDSDELNLSSGGLLYWNKIKNDHNHYLQDKYWQEHDYYLKAKLNAHQADLVITNHALLLTDLVSDQEVLPEYQYVIIDEGHHFEKAAGKHFGQKLDYLSIRLLLGKIGLLESKQLYFQMESLLKRLKKLDPTMSIPKENEHLMPDLFYCMDEFFRMVVIFTKDKVKSRHSSFNRISFRLKKDENGREWTALVTSAERFFFLLKDTQVFIEARMDVIKKTITTLSTEEKTLLEELSSVLTEISELRDGLRNLFLSPLEDYVRWVEMDLRSIQNSTSLYIQPVSISDYLYDRFFQQKKSIILTSATLTVKNSFQFIINELGIDPTICRTEIIPSPFEYDRQIKFFVPEDLPEINTVSPEDYVIAITEHIISIAEATSGRMLILFTSHDMLKKTYDLIKESELLEDFVLIGQGITSGSRTRLTRNFQRFEKAILLGTSSFWEGVDIPGEDLSCLIIVRLPFSPPDEPLTEAKNEILIKKGLNPFSHHSLPEAIIRFKQGFGRLIRTRTDRGVIVVFDRRIVTTRYGKAFLESIPHVPLIKNNIDELVDSITKWLK